MSYRAVCRDIYCLCEWGRGLQELFVFNWSGFDFQSVANGSVQLLGGMRNHQKTREGAHRSLRVIAQHKKRVYKQHALRLNARQIIRVKHRQPL